MWRQSRGSMRIFRMHGQLGLEFSMDKEDIWDIGNSEFTPLRGGLRVLAPLASLRDAPYIADMG